MFGCIGGHIDCVKRMLREGADAEIANDQVRCTQLVMSGLNLRLSMLNRDAQLSVWRSKP
jgi:hypothetical protein